MPAPRVFKVYLHTVRACKQLKLHRCLDKLQSRLSNFSIFINITISFIVYFQREKFAVRLHVRFNKYTSEMFGPQSPRNDFHCEVVSRCNFNGSPSLQNSRDEKGQLVIIDTSLIVSSITQTSQLKSYSRVLANILVPLLNTFYNLFPCHRSITELRINIYH